VTEEAKPSKEQPTPKKPPEPNGGNKTAKVKSPKESSKGSSFFRGVKIIFMLCLIAVLAAGSWLGWNYWQAQLTETDNSQGTILSLQGSVDSIQGQYKLDQERQAQEILQLKQALSSLQLRANTQGQRLAELSSTTRSDWLLAEAVYLTRLANQRLQTERSTKNPLALLANVDVILQELDDPELTPVRGAVAADITALRLAGEVDAEGIFLELVALVKSIDQLDIRLSLAESGPKGDKASIATSAAVAEEPLSSIDSTLALFTQKLSQLIRVRERSQPIEPMLHPKEETVVRQNLRLMLEQAQTGLLREQQGVYSQSIAKAQGWLEQYFQLNPNTQVVSERLGELAKVQVVQQLPAINGSLKAIEAVVAVRQSRLLDSAQQESQQ
jgi:uroporphyrin-3 C-methyltransferase